MDAISPLKGSVLRAILQQWRSVTIDFPLPICAKRLGSPDDNFVFPFLHGPFSRGATRAQSNIMGEITLRRVPRAAKRPDVL